MRHMIPILGVAGRPVLHSMTPFFSESFFRASGDEAPPLHAMGIAASERRPRR